MWSSVIGNHQKINRVAYRRLAELSGLKSFPSRKRINYYEGKRGPDGIKQKSPGEDEPNHFYDPFDPGDTDLTDHINQHYNDLVSKLQEKDLEGAAFESSWLAHTLVDGLTPAHHFPYEEKLAELRQFETSGENKFTVIDKISIQGETKTETVRNNWKFWGIKGLLSTHMLFEGGVAFIAQPVPYRNIDLSKEDLLRAKEIGIEEYFKRAARSIALKQMYESFYKYGWTTGLARQVRDELMPTLIRVVTVAWYLALLEAGMASRKGSKS